MLWLLTDRFEMAKVATPLALSVPLPRVIGKAVPAFSTKETCPAGVLVEPDAVLVTVAVKVTD
jgi:hypothetical protein